MSEPWLKCSACRKDIGFSTVHWVCSVSTCNRNRTRLVFCSVPCWDSHVATLRHREAWAVEAKSPSRAQWQAEQAQHEEAAPPRPAAGPAVVVSRPAAPAPLVRPSAPPGPSPVAAPGAVPSTTSSSSAASATASSQAPGAEDRRRIVTVSPTAVSADPVAAAPELSDTFDRDILIVVSKMKKYIRDRSGMNCSDAVAEILSDHVRLLCDQCIRIASADGRKTVLERDVPRPRGPASS